MHFKILFKLEQTALEKESEKTDQKKGGSPLHTDTLPI